MIIEKEKVPLKFYHIHIILKSADFPLIFKHMISYPFSMILFHALLSKSCTVAHYTKSTVNALNIIRIKNNATVYGYKSFVIIGKF